MDAEESPDGGVSAAPAEAATVISEPSYRTLANGELSPRQRRLAFLAAQGNSNASIAKELGYAESRVSILLKNAYIAAEIQKFQERIYEDTIGVRMRGFADSALNVIQNALEDSSGMIKPREKLETARWVIEKLDGKAVQKLEASGGLLAQLMERLDAQRTAPGAVTQVNITHNYAERAEEREALSKTELPPPKVEVESGEAEEDLLADWFDEFDAPEGD